MICAKCGHTFEDHPKQFLCGIEDCRCPGWHKKVKWDE